MSHWPLCFPFFRAVGMQLQLALALTADTSGKKGAIKCRARSDKSGMIEKRNRTLLKNQDNRFQLAHLEDGA